MLRAILMDFDGVIADTEPLHFKMFQKVMAQEGITLTRKEYYDQYLGLDDRGCFTAVFQSQGRPLRPQDLDCLAKTNARFFKEAIAKEVALTPGAEACIKKLASKYTLAIVSGALKKEVSSILHRGDLKKYFPVIVAAEDVRKGKPHPEGYMKAVEWLNVNVFSSEWPLEPSECLVIEDSPWGIEAAQRAGMVCLALTTSYPHTQVQKADLIVTNLKEISLAGLEKMSTKC